MPSMPPLDDDIQYPNLTTDRVTALHDVTAKIADLLLAVGLSLEAVEMHAQDLGTDQAWSLVTIPDHPGVHTYPVPHDHAPAIG